MRVNERELRFVLTVLGVFFFVVLGYQTLRLWSIGTWALVDTALVTYAAGQALEERFVKWVESINRKVPTPSGRPIFGRLWLLIGFVIGILSAGLVEQFLAKVLVAAASSEISTAVLSVEAWTLLVVSFAYKYLPRRRRQKRVPYLEDMGADFGE